MVEAAKIGPLPSLQKGRTVNVSCARADVLDMIGTIVEATPFVEKARTRASMGSRIATGILAEEGPPAAHGHLSLLGVGGSSVEHLLACW
ncbi:MAG TPA: hypothetical protein VGR29_00530 [Thermomicrobiales bacterium]|nr:hypothetical protein [Thermomicrobiales bacterium]